MDGFGHNIRNAHMLGGGTADLSKPRDLRRVNGAQTINGSVGAE